MKRKKSPLLFLIAICLLTLACKKDKAESPPPDPIAVYDFDNDYATNSVSSVLDGEVEGTMSSTTDSFNTAYGAFLWPGNGYVKVADSDLLDFPGGQFTLAAWIRPSKTSVAYIFHKGDEVGAGGSYSLHIFPGHLKAFVRTTTDEQFDVEGTTPIKKNVWQHVAVTLGNGQLTVYYNGEKEGSTEVDRPLGNSDGDLGIGSYIWAEPGGNFEGKIDNARIYDKALTAGQVKELYKNYKQ